MRQASRLTESGHFPARAWILGSPTGSFRSCPVQFEAPRLPMRRDDDPLFSQRMPPLFPHDVPMLSAARGRRAQCAFNVSTTTVCAGTVYVNPDFTPVTFEGTGTTASGASIELVACGLPPSVSAVAVDASDDTPFKSI